MSRTNSAGGINVQHPKTKSDFERIHKDLIGRGYIAIDVLRKGKVRDINLALSDAANSEASQIASTLGGGNWSNGPLARVAWSFYASQDPIGRPVDKNGSVPGIGVIIKELSA
ncbi:MAG: hypothetical protein ACOCOC_06955 [Prevotella sp.]